MIMRKTKDGKAVSILGFGLMRLPVTKDGKTIDEARVKEMIKVALERKMNYFDTAYFYHYGQSEGAIKNALMGIEREKYFLADKLPAWCAADVVEAEKIFEDQLVKCGVEYFDFYLCHALNKEQFIDKYQSKGFLKMLIGKKAEGKIKRLGFSYHDDAENLEYIASAYDWDFAQLQINYIDWTRQNAKLEYEVLTNHNIPVVVMEPVRGGMLASLWRESEDILRKENNWSSASWALRYVMSLPNVLTVLSGMSNEEQVADNLNTADTFSPLTDKERAALSSAKIAFERALTVPCTGCGYCMDCPFGVDIPKNFKIYNDFQYSRNADEFKNEVKALTKAAASFCKECNKCKEHCPQSIDIPEELKKVSRAFNG